jgi:hypothetical protein
LGFGEIRVVRREGAFADDDNTGSMRRYAWPQARQKELIQPRPRTSKTSAGGF